METDVKNALSNSKVRVRDEEGNYLFRTEWLANYSIIDGPGKWEDVQVTSSPQLYNPADYGEEGNPRYIVNVKAVLTENLPILAELLGEQEYVIAEEVKGLFLNATIWVDEETGTVPALPQKRELVNISTGFVPSANGGEDVLRITDIFVKPGKKASKVNLEAFKALAQKEA